MVHLCKITIIGKNHQNTRKNEAYIWYLSRDDLGFPHDKVETSPMKSHLQQLQVAFLHSFVWFVLLQLLLATVPGDPGRPAKRIDRGTGKRWGKARSKWTTAGMGCLSVTSGTLLHGF